MSEGARAELSTIWARRGVSASELRAGSDGTIGASDRTRLAESDTLASGEGAARPSTPLSPERVELGELLGRGGMGEVRVAIQQSLRREVAVKKVLHPGEANTCSALFKEAWVGAALEHPSVIPVHTLADGEDGAMVLMKRVEGVSFSEVLADPAAHERFRADPLESSLRVLVSVCRAVELAHARGILHLDLKPDNVMVGRYGEVYVLDWGLAAALDHGPEWLARSRDLAAVAGTPAYMAPELVAADGACVDERTDVYLLGGILHTIVTGEPLHAGDVLMAVLVTAYLSEPKVYASDVAPELASILRAATHREREERFASVLAFREALEGFLRHRRADRLVRTAAEVLRELRPRLEAAGGDAEIEPRFAECALALEQARRGWAGHPQLGELSQSLLAARATHEITHERPDAAAAFLAELRPAPEALSAALDALRDRIEAREQRVQRLEALSRDLDLTLGSRARRQMFAVAGTAWLVWGLLLGWISRSGVLEVGYRELLGEGVVLGAIFVPLLLWRRSIYLQNTVNRRLYGALGLTWIAVEMHWVACMLLGLAPAIAVAITPLYYTFAFSTLAVAVDRRFFLGAGALVASLVAAVLWPAASFDVVGVGGGAATALTLFAWRERGA